MPKCVVDRFEAIEVEKHQGDLAMVPSRLSQCVMQAIAKQRPVR